MRVLVCGDRKWQDWDYLREILNKFHAKTPITCIIEGEASGADIMARQWAEAKGIKVRKFKARWDEFGRFAGPKRNQEMIDFGKPEIVLAFHKNLTQSKGTRHMLNLARIHDIPRRIYPLQILKRKPGSFFQ
jgi:hypothetical protein